MRGMTAMEFTALKDFYSEETRSQYAKGMSYTARDDKLLKLLPKWREEGKIELGRVQPARITGKG